MKIKQLILSTAILTMAVSLSFMGCRKPKDANDNDTSGASDNALADQSFNDMHQISNEGSQGGVSSYKSADYNGILSSCATVDTTGMAANKRFTVDFGTANCQCHDGRWRRGKIFVSYTPGFHGLGYWDSLCSITITTKDPITNASNYFVGPDQNTMHQVIGTRTVTNNGRNITAHHLNWSVTESGQIIKANNQGTITWNATRNREWTAGDTTPFNWLDDVYSITGSASGTHANGSSFTMTITSPLIVEIGCMYHFVSGTFDYTPGTKPTRHVDFSPPSNGACDNIATVVISNKTYTIHF
jgi:hypothetical protein